MHKIATRTPALARALALRALLLAPALMVVVGMAHARTSAAAGAAPDEALVSTTFSCRIESNGTRTFSQPGSADSKIVPVPCAYRLYVTRCEGTGDAEHREQRCQTRTLTEFKLNAGETKELTKLPANFHYCIGTGETPSLDQCIKTALNP